MTEGQHYVALCAGYAGRVVEATGNNDGPQIRTWQVEAARVYGYADNYYLGAAWCGIGAGCVAREAGIAIASRPDEYRLWHPYTGYIADQADKMGGLYPDKVLAPTGALIVKAGVHVGVIANDRGDGTLDTIEFNAGNAVRRMLRTKAEWRIVVPPGIGGYTEPQWVDSYGFDDLTVKPSRLGGWLTDTIRDDKMAGWLSHHPDWWTRKVKTPHPSPYAFWTGPPGTWEDDWAWWEYGGWTAGGDAKAALEVREAQIDRFTEHYGHGNVRRWRRRVPVPTLGIPDRSGSLVAADGISTR